MGSVVLGLPGAISRLGHELEQFTRVAYHESKALHNHSVGDQTLRPVQIKHGQQKAHEWQSSSALGFIL